MINPGGAPAPRTPGDRWLIGPPCGLRIRDDQRITDYSRPGANLEVARKFIKLVKEEEGEEADQA